jgi:hypothetical protein
MASVAGFVSRRVGGLQLQAPLDVRTKKAPPRLNPYANPVLAHIVRAQTIADTPLIKEEVDVRVLII